MGTWFNPDGLFRKFGTTKAVPNTGGEYRTTGELREIEIQIDLTTLTASPIIQNDEIFVPAGVRVQEVEVFTQTGATGTSTLSVGLISTDRSTTLGATGFLNVSPLANITTAGQKTVYTQATTGAGTFMTTSANLPTVGYITATGTATAFTTGLVKVRIRYYRPNTN